MNYDQVEMMGILAEKAYDNWNQGELVKDTQYSVVAKRDMPSGMQAYLLMDTAGNYVFAFRGTEADPFFTGMGRGSAINYRGNFKTEH